ncbi:MAG TPA: peptidylprolyl isomerase [Candidatus Nanoarchaeia archaeon]|nr:peptidylprolyl isomerase [Candidatus Nanoarchaeia archaeon]
MTSEQIEKGDKVKVDYEGKLDSGEIFDSTKHGDHSHPLEFVIGGGQIIPAFENAVIGMKEGEEKSFTVKPEDAYGEYQSEMKKQLPRSQVPLEKEPEEGMMLEVKTPDGKRFPVKIDSFDENNITLDLNHPLAGKTLNFSVKISGIEKGAGEKSEEKKENETSEESENKEQESTEESSSEDNKQGSEESLEEKTE